MPVKRPTLAKWSTRLYASRISTTLSCLQDGLSVESSITRFHLNTLRVAEVVPHLGLPVIRQHTRRESKFAPGPGVPTPDLPGKLFWGLGGGSPTSRMSNEPPSFPITEP